MIIKEVYRRNLKYPGLSKSIVIDANTGERLEPIQEVRSRTLAHGLDVYEVITPVYILRYSRSNTGKASWEVVYVNPFRERPFEKRFFDKLPKYVKDAILRECEKEGIELHPWEEIPFETTTESL